MAALRVGKRIREPRFPEPLLLGEHFGAAREFELAWVPERVGADLESD